MADEVEKEVTEEAAQDAEGQMLRTRASRATRTGDGAPSSDPERTTISDSDDDVEGQGLRTRIL